MLIDKKAAMLIELIAIESACVNISVGCLILFYYFKLKKIFHTIKMDAEELLQNVACEQKDIEQDTKRERLSSIVA
jgi:hypothetical protein